MVHGRDHLTRPAALWPGLVHRPLGPDVVPRPRPGPGPRRVRHGSLRAGGPHDDDTHHRTHHRPRCRCRAPAGARPFRRDVRRPAPRRARHGAARPQLALRGRRDRPGAPRRSGAGRVRGQDPLVHRVRVTGRGGDRAEGRAAAAARRPLARGARCPAPGGPARRRRRARAAVRRSPRSSTSAGSADGLGDSAHHLVVRRDRAPDRRTGGPGAGRRGHGPGGPTGRLDQRGPRPVPGGGGQQRLRLAVDPAGDDPAVPGRPAEERAALRPEHRRRRLVGRR